MRIFTRDRNKAEKIFGKHYDIVEGNLENEASLVSALQGCYGAHINLQGGPKPADFDRIEHQGTAGIVDAAVKAKVKRITCLSGSSVGEDRLWFPPTRAKHNAEQALMNSGLEYVIFRATWFMESLPLFVRDGKAIIMGKQPLKFHWLAAEDYARMVAAAYSLDEPLKNTLTIWGPEEYTFEEALRIYGEGIGMGMKISHVPISVLKFIAAITFNRQLREALPTMTYFERNGELGDPEPADNLLGQPKTTLARWCERVKTSTQHE